MHVLLLTLLSISSSPVPDFRLAPAWERDDPSLPLSVELNGSSMPVTNRNTVRGVLVVDGVNTGVRLDGGSLRNRPLPDGSQLLSYWNHHLYRWDKARRALDDLGSAATHPVEAVFPARSPGAVVVVERQNDACLGGLTADFRSVVTVWCTGPASRSMVQAVTAHGKGFRALVLRDGVQRSVVTVVPGQAVQESPLPDSTHAMVVSGLQAIRIDHVALVDLTDRTGWVRDEPFRAPVVVFNVVTGDARVVGSALGVWRQGGPHVSLEWVRSRELADRRYPDHAGAMERAMNLLVEETLQLVVVVPR